jgi:hypothetical protein
MVAGFVNFAWDPESPLSEILAAMFGVGVGLTLDEFALWVYLRDVYWAEEGRTSFDAVVVATVFAGLILVGVAPFDVSGAGTTIGSLSIVLVLDLLLSVVVIYKGKPLVGVIGIFVPLVSLVGALRLASPDSRWARRRYGAGSEAEQSGKLERSRERWQRIEDRRRRITDAVAGAPHIASGASETARRGGHG